MKFTGQFKLSISITANTAIKDTIAITFTKTIQVVHFIKPKYSNQGRKNNYIHMLCPVHGIKVLHCISCISITANTAIKNIIAITYTKTYSSL